MNYVRKHWRGELPLAVSFWVNVCVVNLVVMLIQTALSRNPLAMYPPTAARLGLGFIVVVTLLMYPWQIVGLWRSCSRHVHETKKAFWPRTAQVLVVIGLLGTVANVNKNWPIYRDAYRLGFQKDPMGSYVLNVEQNDRLIHLVGWFAFGVSDDFADLLNENPGVSGLILDSPGGRLYEGRELAKLISDNGLDTYSVKGCYSACTTAFISGKERFLATGANLGFHQYRVHTYDSFEPYIDLKAEQKKDLAIFQRQNVSDDFIDRLFTTTNDDLWYPTREELLDANVIHALVDPSDIVSAEYKDQLSLSEIDRVLLDVPAFKAIKKYDPGTYNKLAQELDLRLRKGASVIEVQNSMSEHVQILAEKSLSKTSDDSLMRFIRVLLPTLTHLKEKDPILCLKYVYPDRFGSVDTSKYLSDEQIQSLLEMLNQVIIDAHEKQNPSVNRELAEATFSQVATAMGDEALYLEAIGLQNKEDYGRACDAVITFYRLVGQRDESTAANALRYGFSDIE